MITVAIVDYGLGNLFSVKHACEQAGIQTFLASSPQEILSGDAVILPGVGAFSDAMASLRRLNLIEPLKEIVLSQKPLIGICLGMQLLMTESFEFGYHKGLGIIKGSVVQFENPIDGFNKLKVPQVGWNRIFKRNEEWDQWTNSLLEGLQDGEFMYFTHSFYVKLREPNLALSISRYGNIEFCSSLKYRNVIAFQFHPERSGRRGLEIYQNLASFIKKDKKVKENANV